MEEKAQGFKGVRLFALVGAVLFISYLMIVLTFFNDTPEEHSNAFHFILWPLKHKKVSSSAWDNQPRFEMYIRMTSQEHIIREYGLWFLRGFRQNFPPDRWHNALVLGFDDENPLDHTVGDFLHATWPYPRIKYHPKSENGKTYRYTPQYRIIWDQFHPDTYIETEYVGYAEPCTLFSSIVTPNSLFIDGKPIVIGLIGQAKIMYSSLATRYILGFDEVMQCRSYFPIIFKRQHIVELRHHVEHRFNESFKTVFYRSFKFGPNSVDPYSVMCNYVWRFRREDYTFRFQVAPKEKLKWYPGMQKFEVLEKENKEHPERFFPSPRVALNGKDLLDRQGNWISADMDHPFVVPFLNSTLIESFCRVSGFDMKCKFCKEFERYNLFAPLFQFEKWSWTWHGHCKDTQKEYILESRNQIDNLKATGFPVFGAHSKGLDCSTVRNAIIPSYTAPMILLDQKGR